MMIFAIILTISQIIILYFLFNKETKENIAKEQTNDLLRLRLESLKHEAMLINNDINTTRIIRHDLRHHYRLLYALLKDNSVEAALEHIDNQKLVLEALQEKNKEL
ncbi:MAG: hypothetical protein K6C05_09110 [Anaerovibrio sp.]|uniref:hypothetical protein n=1 Tax=Anaerovibrio sp. TaxID=1872532 RepID=UPI0025D8CCA3|nr:hypothetical protein [Anaerovibrio sp.]MCR5176991.1 hypothetical protein [Anaerovibrio sp.]